MGTPNKKLDKDMSVYEDVLVLKKVCRKGSEYLDSVNAQNVSEIKGLDIKARWICCSEIGSGKHFGFWATPRAVIQAELRGDSGCVHCMALREEDIITRAEFVVGCKAQDKSQEKSDRKALRAVNRFSNNYGLQRY